MRTEIQFRNELNHAIDFDKVLQQFSSYTSFSLSCEKIKAALPNLSLYQIQEDLKLVEDSIHLFQSGSTLSLQGCFDIEESIKKTSKQMTLSPSELWEIQSVLTVIRRVINTLKQEEKTKLQEYAATMDPCTELMKSIQKCVDATGSIKEDASVTLIQKFHELSSTKSALTSKTRDFVKHNSMRLMENLTTSISGRVCVLVKASEKNAFGGMIHGQSQSGLAYYVEPSAFVPFNNQIQLVLSQIEEEKMRICKELSMQVAKKERTLLSNMETLTLLDCAFAKARWAKDYDGCVPVLQTKDHALKLENARHPMIDQKKVVANTYQLRSNQKILMITGPNMGGKTVTLKTIGLFVALSHSGFPVSAHHAMMPYYRSLWFDIGDQQSIENNLSTFSSHISSLSRICSSCDGHSFVLLDEVGNGTDPLEGSSLAIAILEYLAHKEATIITSTHYNAVKTFGKTHPEVLVSTMQFDKDTLQPTYRYIPGVSGASYAFYIARQYQLDPKILERAKALKEEAEDLNNKELEKLERLQNEVVQEKEKFDQLIRKAHQIQKEADENKRKWEKEKERFDKEYNERLQEMLAQKEKEADELFKELHKKDTLKLHEQTKFFHDLSQLEPETKEQNNDEVFSVGDYVKIADLNTHGEIIDLKKKEATVLTNGMKMKVKTNTLHKIKRPKVQQPVFKQRKEKVFTRVPLELNIIGYHVQEGLSALDHYLDQCVAHQIKQVRIIHGMGTGKLRTAVLNDLKKHPNVKEYMAAGPSDGGLGATIVVLK